MEDSLRLVSFLRDLTDEELATFAGLLNVKDVAPGTRIIEEGTEVDTLYIVCSGVVHVRRLSAKHEMLLGRLGVGAFFGEINLFDPGVATASIYVMKEKVTLGYVDY
ncbi:MAG: cyclic nucleotide-binding domain-containing protein, partial [Chthoniobacteraceae bacterium]